MFGKISDPHCIFKNNSVRARVVRVCVGGWVDVWVGVRVWLWVREEEKEKDGCKCCTKCVVCVSRMLYMEY